MRSPRGGSWGVVVGAGEDRVEFGVIEEVTKEVDGLVRVDKMKMPEYISRVVVESNNH